MTFCFLQLKCKFSFTIRPYQGTPGFLSFINTNIFCYTTPTIRIILIKSQRKCQSAFSPTCCCALLGSWPRQSHYMFPTLKLKQHQQSLLRRQFCSKTTTSDMSKAADRIGLLPEQIAKLITSFR